MEFLVLAGVLAGLYVLSRPTPTATNHGGGAGGPAVDAWPGTFGRNGLAAWNRFTPQGLARILAGGRLGPGYVWVQVGAPQVGLVTLSVSPTQDSGADSFVGLGRDGAKWPFTAAEVYAVSPARNGGIWFVGEDAAIAFLES